MSSSAVAFARQNHPRFLDELKALLRIPSVSTDPAHKELDVEERLVVVCHHGVRSMNVTAWLRRQGFEKAQSLRGGIDAWSVEVDPKVARY